MKHDSTKDKMSKVEARYGKTLGASKGSKPAPKAKIKPRPMGGLKPHGVKVTWKKEF